MHFFAFFRFFSFFFALNVSLHFEAKQSEAKFKSIFSFFSLFFTFFSLLLPSFSLQIFGVSHRSESCEIRLFFASKRNKIFASISNFASEAKVRAHPNSEAVKSEVYGSKLSLKKL